MNKFFYVGSLVKEFGRFARAHKVYWIMPLVLVMILFVVLISVGQISAPFIYTLF